MQKRRVLQNALEYAMQLGEKYGCEIRICQFKVHPELMLGYAVLGGCIMCSLDGCTLIEPQKALISEMVADEYRLSLQELQKFLQKQGIEIPKERKALDSDVKVLLRVKLDGIQQEVEYLGDVLESSVGAGVILGLADKERGEILLSLNQFIKLEKTYIRTEC